MAYQKPGVTVRQVQRTASFPLPDPTLESCIIGEGYYWQDISREDNEMNSVYSGSYDGTQLEIPLSYFTSYSDVVEDSVYIDLVRAAGVSGNPGEITSLSSDDFTVTAGTITIDADITGYTDGTDKANVRVGFLAENTDIAGTFAKISEANDIRNLITGGSSAEWFNPLAFGADVAQANSGLSVNVIGVARGASGDSADFSPAVSTANLKKNLYALAPMTGQSAETERFDAHVTTASQPANKKERVALTSRFNNSYSAPADDAAVIKAYSEGIGNKRFVNIWPEAVYVRTVSHISTLKSTFVQAVFGSSFDIKSKLPRNTKIGNTTYAVDTELTDSLLDTWAANLDSPYVEVDVAVPGFYLAAGLAGAVSAKDPAEPLTNAAITGFSDVYRSNDYFSNTELDTMASGGTWIFENKGGGSITTRHQLSTNAITIETRELSITTQVDFASKFLRDLVEPLIGRFVITDGFINQLRSAFNGGATQLIEDGVVRDLQVISVTQDETNPDTINAEFDLLPLYPVNYIRITLTL